MKRPMITVALACIIALGGLPVSPAGASEGSDAIIPVVTWSMADRFGGDDDGDGFVDLPNTPEYAHNRVPGSCQGGCPEAKFGLIFEAGLSGATTDLAGLPVTSYRWTVSGGALQAPLHYTTLVPELRLLLSEGHYTMAVAAGIRIGWVNLSASVVEDFEVEDLLIVAIGDSYASGEGNPEAPRVGSSFPARWAGSSDPAAAATHAAARRSTVAWPARVALAMERVDRTTSVTFISVAASGASIDRGILSAQGGDLNSSQIDEMKRLVGDRRIDVLLIQAGGNDVGFVRAVRRLIEADPMLDPICYDMLIENIFSAVRDGDWSRGVSLGYKAPFSLVCRPDESRRGWSDLPGLDGLPAAFDRLDHALALFEVGTTVIVGYPDPTGSDIAGESCREIVGDVTPPFGLHEIDRKEQKLGLDLLLGPLNDAISDTASRRDWIFVGGVAEAFAAGHGYCAPWPDYGYPPEYGHTAPIGGARLSYPEGWFRNPGRGGGPMLLGGIDVTWYRTAAQSAVLQGPGVRFDTTGTLHPNEVGHHAIARLVLAAMGPTG
jgi:lysophospholipase L1-like esterase